MTLQACEIRHLLDRTTPRGGTNVLTFARRRLPIHRGRDDRWEPSELGRDRSARLLRHLGIGFALRYRLHRLTLDAALARVHALSGARIAVVESRFGLAAVDVDKPDDLDLVRRLAAAGRG